MKMNKFTAYTVSLACRFLGLALVFTGTASTAIAFDTPEINPGSATSAIALLTGGVLLLADRFRGK